MYISLWNLSWRFFSQQNKNGIRNGVQNLSVIWILDSFLWWHPKRGLKQVSKINLLAWGENEKENLSALPTNIDILFFGVGDFTLIEFKKMLHFWRVGHGCRQDTVCWTFSCQNYLSLGVFSSSLLVLILHGITFFWGLVAVWKLPLVVHWTNFPIFYP